MKKIFVSGLTTILMLGLIGFLFKLVVMDFLAGLFRPLILIFAGENLVIPLTIIFVVIIVFLIGIPASHIKFQEVINRFVERMLPKQKRGVLVEKLDGIYDLAIVITKIHFRRINGEIQSLYLLFYPSTPVIWTSGLPIGLAREDKVIPITNSLREILATIATYGQNAPETFVEKDDKNFESAD